MNNLPQGADLLKIARDTLVKEVLPNASADVRYALLMIANAMAIAAREAETGAASMTSEEEDALARDIRAGRYDTPDGRQREMLRRLREAVLRRLRISNPKAIAP